MAHSQDDFKWFGEGFDGFPRGLPNDCVEYALYIVDSKLQQNDIRQRLRSVQASAHALAKQLLQGFIWQHESFRLELVHENGLSLLRGRTDYGDSVEDEWLIVYILRQLSRQHSELFIRVVDADGQFLLIEAASSKLPKWLNPEVAENRVWINKGQLFILPPEASINGPTSTRSPASNMTLPEALHYLEERHSQLLHVKQVEDEAFHRLEKYPQQIRNSLHHALITIPRKLAYVLHEDETYVSPAIEAFYLRDPISLRPVQATDTKKLIFPPEDLVTVSTKFTKVGYAQLKSQQFSTPNSWIKDLTGSQGDASQAKTEGGMKLTCGFEMLMQDPQNRDKRQVREIMLLVGDINTEKDSLPSDTEIAQWRQTEDDEQWLDINFDDFEKELAGTKDSSTLNRNGFGDKAAQANLRRIVGKFQGFLNDDRAGPEGAEDMDDIDDDDDDDDETGIGTSSDGSEIETAPKDVEFKEEDFSSMLKGLWDNSATKSQQASKSSAKSHDVELHSFADTKSEKKEMRKAMLAMEQELRDAGALRLDTSDVPKDSTSQRPFRRGLEDHGHRSVPNKEDDQPDEDLNIDVNLAKNLLASFNGQAGSAGPSGTLMGLMGMRIPRDEAGEPGQP